MILSDLSSKSILVTGASRGIGKTIALSLAAQKAHVVFNYRGDEAQAKELAGAIEAAGGKATALKFDITDVKAMTEALDAYFAAGNTLQGLVNNAGKSKDQLMLRVKPDDVEDLLNVNLKSTMVLTNYLSKHLMKAGGASIVNMSSIVGLMGNTAQTVYAATKAGLIGYTKSVAKELSSRQVRCNAICPGFIATDMTAALPEKAREEYSKNIPLGRFGETQDVANLVCFLLSNASNYITGEVIKIDGGLYI
ncbi:MAG: 3-oxoacyl-ACP reductase FabG [Bacteriovoracaceae bacterium]|nr:3-oxoacyl-ACP reductase FabG [Bacteriovoracaceae bacterium]